MKTRIVLLCIILFATSAVIARSSRPEIVPVREHLSGIPMRLGDWAGQTAPDLDSKVLAILGVDDYINRVYYNPESFPASLYIGYYQSQTEGDTIHSPLNCLPGAGWNPTKRGHISIQENGNAPIEINRIIIIKGVDKQVVLYWYQSHGRAIASEYWAKIHTVLDALRTNRTDAALVRIICPVPGTDSQAEAFSEKRAAEFAKALYPLLGQFIPL
jgi:EpsI family protein